MCRDYRISGKNKANLFMRESSTLAQQVNIFTGQSKFSYLPGTEENHLFYEQPPGHASIPQCQNGTMAKDAY